MLPAPRDDPGGDLERAERTARVAVRGRDQEVAGLGSEREPERAEAALAIGERPLEDLPQLRFAERMEHDHARARQQRRDDLEGGILGRRAEQHHGAALDVRQERILLRLVEAMDLVDEEHGLSAVQREA